MQKVIGMAVCLILMTGLSFSQSFWWNIPKSSYESAPGAAVETAVEVGFCQPHSDSVVFSAEAPAGVEALFQPRSIFYSQRVVLMMVIMDSTVRPGFIFNRVRKQQFKRVIILPPVTL